MEKEIEKLIIKCEGEYTSLCNSLQELTDKLDSANLTNEEAKSICDALEIIGNGLNQNRERLIDYSKILSKIK